MKDAKGRELKAGDVVMIPCKLGAVNDKMVSAFTEGTMPGETDRDRLDFLFFIPPEMIIRANPGDDVSYTLRHDGPARIVS